MKRGKPDPSKVYVCVTPFAATALSVAQGTRLRGDHRAVREYLQYFVEDGTPPDEWPRPKLPVYHQEPPRVAPIPVERQVRARRSFTAWHRGRHHVVARGAIYDREDPLVGKVPEEFETLPQPLEAAVA